RQRTRAFSAEGGVCSERVGCWLNSDRGARRIPRNSGAAWVLSLLMCIRARWPPWGSGLGVDALARRLPVAVLVLAFVLAGASGCARSVSPALGPPEYMFDLGLALEGLEERAGARDEYLELARRFPTGLKARSALVRAATLDAYLEDWTALAAIGDTLLARPDLEDLERIVALGARGLALVEQGQLDTPSSTDIYDGLDLSDRFHYGERDVLPVAVAQLRFALGELRRGRSERIQFDPLPPDYLDKLDERCAGLLEAQSAYSQAVRSVDPHWAAMSGYRVGEMYRNLHRDLMGIPPP